jgi:hypothetical protein
MRLHSAGLPLLVILGLLVAPLAAEAQRRGKARRIGVLGGGPLCEGKNLSLGRP